MADARVTQVEVEAAVGQPTVSRVSQVEVEAAVQNSPSARVSQYTLELAILPGVVPPPPPSAPSGSALAVGGASRCGCCAKLSRFSEISPAFVTLRKDRQGWWASYRGANGLAGYFRIRGRAGLGGLAAATAALQSEMADQVRQAAIRYGVDPSLALAVARHESGFDPNAVSPVGAVGVMQLMPGTAADLGVDPYDPLQNITGGIRYLKGLLERFGGNVQAALVGYNWGPQNAQKWLSGKTGLPAETSRYVSAVLGDSSVAYAGGDDAGPPAADPPAAAVAPAPSSFDLSGLFGRQETSLSPVLLGSLLLGGLGLLWAATD